MTEWLFLLVLFGLTLRWLEVLVLPLEPWSLLIFGCVLSYLCYRLWNTHRQPVPSWTEEQNTSGDHAQFFRGISLYDLIAWGLVLIFIAAGSYRLGKFFTVDEPLWLFGRIPQLMNAMSSGDLALAEISNKPGIVHSVLTLTGQLIYYLVSSVSGNQGVEPWLFWSRFPILLFNAGMLLLGYRYVTRLLGKPAGLLTIGFIALNPVLLGNSIIVNADDALWSTAFLSVILFFLYVKTSNQKYILYSGLFLGLALLSKNFAAILLLFMPLWLVVEYLFRPLDREQLFTRLGDWFLSVGLTVYMVAVLYPAVWVKPMLLWDQTFGVNKIAPGVSVTLVLILILSCDILLNGERGVNLLRRYLNFNFINNSIFIGVLIVVGLAGIHYLLGDPIFALESVQSPGRIAQMIRSGIGTIYRTVLSLMPVLLISLMLTVIFSFQKKFHPVHGWIVACSLFLVLGFLGGGVFIGYGVGTRYQVMLYPVYAIVGSLMLTQVKSSWFRTSTLAVLLTGGLVSLMLTAPFYHQYYSVLNVRQIRVRGLWGFGGYEVAQYLQQRNEATEEDLVVWSDYKGVDLFYQKGPWHTRADFSSPNPFNPDSEVDYLVLTPDGHRLFTRILQAGKDTEHPEWYPIVKESPLLDYYDKQATFEFCVFDNPNLCHRVVPLDSDDLRTGDD